MRNLQEFFCIVHRGPIEGDNYLCPHCKTFYCVKCATALKEKGVCREQARIVVPVGNYTEFYATANLRNWMSFYRLRSAPDAQWEIRKYAIVIGQILEQVWPESWDSLKKSL